MTDSPQALLRKYNLRPKHSWGQNFLGDEDTLAKIADAIAVGPEDTVVELGPGLGHLTRYLLATGAKVVAIERDRDMARVLREQLPDGLTVIEANAADVSFAQSARAADVAVIGNLPYHLTSPILFQVMDQRPSVRRAVFTLQKEVVERIAAEPGGRDYGLLSVLLGLWFDLELLFTIPAHKFHPPPKVDSAVVRLTRRAAPRADVTSDSKFRRVVKAAFAQRRKTVLNSLSSDRSLGDKAALAAALSEAGVEATRRAETMSVEEFAALERAL